MSKYVNAADAAEKIAEKHGIRIADLYDAFGDIPAADVVPAVKLEDLRAKYQGLVDEKDKNSGDAAETYITRQIKLLQQILDIFDGVSES